MSNCKDQYLVSVIVPVYNIEKYISKCIDSILCQTYKNIEVLLINDGSQDNSRNICEQYSKLDNRVKLINKINGGLSDARNAGIYVAKGEYIVFIDGDDYIKKNYISLLLENILKEKAQISVCSFEIVDDNGDLLKTEYLSELQSGIKGTDLLSEVLTSHGYKYVVAWNKIYHRSMFSDTKFDKGKIYEDEFINFRLFWECEKVGIVEEPLYCYAQRNGSITQSNMTIEKINMKNDMHKKRIDFYQSKDASTLCGNACQLYCNWIVECTRLYSDLLSSEDKSQLQKEIRFYSKLANKNNNLSLGLKLQNMLGCISLKMASCVKNIYKK